MLKRVLVACRGEIALRIVRACREMEIETVAVYSTADRDSLHCKLATRAVCIGPEKAADSYLNKKAIVSAAVLTGCDAIHPGYGFLSENADFADACSAAGLTFIGPSGTAMRTMGDKSAARKLMQESGVPIVPGTSPLEDADEALGQAEHIGYPVLVKASAGGGGRGMRRVADSESLPDLFAAASSEAFACFGNGEVYLEKLIENPRHIEFQILGDRFGNIIHLGERDCSVQRRNQKLMEESPSHALTPELRGRMGDAAVQAARAVGYENAGTVEFVLDAEQRFYFIEMNARIQVEHPVTEMVSGVDLVHEQLRIAAGLPLSMNQDQVMLKGWSIECRINAEDPAHGFLPSLGTVRFMHLPAGPGVRVDTALYTGYEPSPFYDSLVAKVIVHAPNRLEAIRRMRRALEELIIDGFATNARIAYLTLYHPDYLRGTYTTSFMADNLDDLLAWDARSNDQLEEKE
jgi:acetyl-CoA carboxylase biotin carboxylase subunit